MNGAQELTSLEKTGTSSPRTNPRCSQCQEGLTLSLWLSPPHGDTELRLYLDPHDVGWDLQAGGPAQGVQEVTVTHLRGVHGQMVHVAFGGRQNAQDPPQDQEVVLKGTGFLNTGTVGKINTERLQFPSLQLLKYLLRDPTLLQMCQIR